MQIKIKELSPKAGIPEYAHGPLEDAGLDLRSIEDCVAFAECSHCRIYRSRLGNSLRLRSAIAPTQRTRAEDTRSLWQTRPRPLTPAIAAS